MGCSWKSSLSIFLSRVMLLVRVTYIDFLSLAAGLRRRELLFPFCCEETKA